MQKLWGLAHRTAAVPGSDSRALGGSHTWGYWGRGGFGSAAMNDALPVLLIPDNDADAGLIQQALAQGRAGEWRL